MNQTQRLIDNLLQQTKATTLAIWLADKRDAGLSYEKIARELHDTTDGIVDVTWQTVSRWCNDLHAEAS